MGITLEVGCATEVAHKCPSFGSQKAIRSVHGVCWRFRASGSVQSRALEWRSIASTLLHILPPRPNGRRSLVRLNSSMPEAVWHLNLLHVRVRKNSRSDHRIVPIRTVRVAENYGKRRMRFACICRCRSQQRNSLGARHGKGTTPSSQHSCSVCFGLSAAIRNLASDFKDCPVSNGRATFGIVEAARKVPECTTMPKAGP